MRPIETHELLESIAVGLDPVVDGFGGVLMELVNSGDEFVLTETASVTGNRLLRFSSRSEGEARDLLEKELRKGGNRPPFEET